MNKQKGLALSDFLFWTIIVAVVGLISLTILPSYMEYMTIKKTVDNIAHLTGEYKNIDEARKAYDRQANIDGIEVDPKLTIRKVGQGVQIKFAYEKRVPLVANVSFLMEFEHDTSLSN
ncbi:hypothetical protein AGMMS50289_13030 [Betaproteobacteria bacterium]|nr:hypothetical protein AGMMS50289_13030 [Betaproteobacteria bacterium]